MHLHPSELSPPRSESPPPPSEPALPLAELALGGDYGATAAPPDYGGGDQLNGDDYYGAVAAAPPPGGGYGGDEYGNGAGVLDYSAAAPPPPPPPHEFSQQAGPPGERDEYMEPPSPMDPHCASMGGQSHASIGSIGEDIDVNSHGLVEETLERLSRVRGVLGVLLLDGAGTVIRTTMEDRAVAKYSAPVAQLLQRAHGVVGLTPHDRLGMLCVRTSKHEMLMCNQHGFSILVLQARHVLPSYHP
mmetsp:Transcript_30805/g.73091  ORF Transcript_30805/g.73091 Transcript_30805/m.73091 type:complete len:245 (+) Transcript_30805:48-782(+)